MIKLKVTNGAVAFFDILGYASFLDASGNSPEKAAARVIDILLRIPKELSRRPPLGMNSRRIGNPVIFVSLSRMPLLLTGN